MIVTKLDNVNLQITSDNRGALYDLHNYFTFEVPNYYFKRSSFSQWDGKIHLFNRKSQTLYVGLLSYLQDFARQFEYDLEIDPALTNEEVDPIEVKKFIDAQDIRNKHEEVLDSRFYQSAGVYHIINRKRVTLVSPTASGKSLMLYLFSKWFLDNNKGKIMLIVPTTSLVLQMQGDFSDYSQTAIDDHVHIIYSGKEKESKTAKIYITTWQSMQYLDKEYFDQFNAVIVDECHGLAAKQLKRILENTQAEYRVGITGTLQDAQAHKWIIEGLLGPVVDLISMKELMEKGWIAKLKIKCLVFEHRDKTKTQKLKKYFDEINYLVSNESRNNKILQLMGHLKENQFVLFDRIEHGKYLYEKAKELYPERDIYLIYGINKAGEREEVRLALENKNNSIVIASYKIFSVGVSVNNLFHIIFAHPFKSKIRLFQSIGRSLRLHSEKDYATLWDIADKFPGKKLNYTLKHFQERIMAYNQKELSYTIQTFELHN